MRGGEKTTFSVLMHILFEVTTNAQSDIRHNKTTHSVYLTCLIPKTCLNKNFKI